MRKIITYLAVISAIIHSPIYAQTGPKMGKNGGIGSSTSTYDAGEPTGGTYSINGTNGAATFNGQIANVRSNNTAGDGSTDDGAKIASSINAAGIGGVTVFPHTANGYMLNSGGFPLGTYPSQTWSWPSNTGVYPQPGWYSLGNNRFQGTAIGNPENCTGFLMSPYTQTCLAITDHKIIMDPASVWAGPNTVNTGFSIGCLPNHRSPNAANVTSAGLRRNWIACMYWEADTGQDGQPNAGGSGFGSGISTEVVNATLGVGSNHGILQEDNVNIYGAPTDGGITRDQFILASCGPFNSGTYSGTQSCQASVKSGKNPWGVTTEQGIAIDINATPFTSTTAPSAQTNGNGETVYSGSAGNYTVYPRWTTGVSAFGSVYNFTAGMNVAGESGLFFRGQDTTGANRFSVDKNGNVQISAPAGQFRFLHFDTAGVSRWEVGEDAGAETGSNAGSNFYISRRADNGSGIDQPLYILRSTGMVTVNTIFQLPAKTVGTLPTCNTATKGAMVYVTDSSSTTYNATASGGGSNTLPVFCNGTNWTNH